MLKKTQEEQITTLTGLVTIMLVSCCLAVILCFLSPFILPLSSVTFHTVSSSVISSASHLAEGEEDWRWQRRISTVASYSQPALAPPLPPCLLHLRLLWGQPLHSCLGLPHLSLATPASLASLLPEWSILFPFCWDFPSTNISLKTSWKRCVYFLNLILLPFSLGPTSTCPQQFTLTSALFQMLGFFFLSLKNYF